VKHQGRFLKKPNGKKAFLSILEARKLYRTIRSNYPNGQWDHKFSDFKTKEVLIKEGKRAQGGQREG
jgi:hypothetical protein